MSHLDINLNHSTSVTSLFDLLPVTFGLENGIVCSSQVILNFVNYSDSPVRSLFACWHLFLGYDGRNGIFPKNREVSWKPHPPCLRGSDFPVVPRRGTQTAVPGSCPPQLLVQVLPTALTQGIGIWRWGAGEVSGQDEWQNGNTLCSNTLSRRCFIILIFLLN